MQHYRKGNIMQNATFSRSPIAVGALADYIVTKQLAMRAANSQAKRMATIAARPCDNDYQLAARRDAAHAALVARAEYSVAIARFNATI